MDFMVFIYFLQMVMVCASVTFDNVEHNNIIGNQFL